MSVGGRGEGRRGEGWSHSCLLGGAFSLGCWSCMTLFKMSLMARTWSISAAYYPPRTVFRPVSSFGFLNTTKGVWRAKL